MITRAPARAVRPPHPPPAGFGLDAAALRWSRKAPTEDGPCWQAAFLLGAPSPADYHFQRPCVGATFCLLVGFAGDLQIMGHTISQNEVLAREVVPYGRMVNLWLCMFVPYGRIALRNFQ